MRLILAILLLSVAGCANATEPMSRGGDGGQCGAELDPCCGAGFCNSGLACIAGVCTASSCGGEAMTCCAMGAACGPGLYCAGSTCLREAGDGGAPTSCGMRGEACCTSGAACEGGLACVAGSCRDPGPCGETGETCCGGDVCNPGNLCVDGTCRREVPVPMCNPLGGSCGGDVDCCEGTCQSGTCRTAPSTPPPPDDRCRAFSCYDCTLLENCGFCDGTCIYVTDPSAPPCVSFQWTIVECF